MENHFSRHWPVWVVVGAMGFSFYWVSKSWNTGSPIVTGEEMSYEMPRPEVFEPGYDLSGRKVVRTFDRTQRIASVDGPEALRKPMSPAKTVTPAKKTDPKKNAQANNQKRKPVVSTRVIPANKKGFLSTAQATSSNSNGGGYYGAYNPKATPTALAADDKKNENLITPAQWREILLSSPTSENANKFFAAYSAGQVDAASFYKIADELLSDSSQNRQQAGLDILRKDVSVSSFAVLSKHYDDSTSPDLKTGIYTVLQSYGMNGKLSVLSKVFSLNDEKAVTIASEILADAVSTNQSGSATNQIGDRGGVRSPGATAAIEAGQWKLFLPGLQRLATSSNAALAERARSLLASIQAMT